MKKLFGTLMILALMLALLPATAMAQSEEDAFVVHLIAGQNIYVGEVKVWNDADYLYVKYEIADSKSDWCITETHLAVAMSLEGIPQTKKGNPIPGRFPYSRYHDCVSEYTYEIPLSKDWQCDAELYIAAHAVVETCEKECQRTETAWGKGTSFDGSNWGMYFTYKMPPCECPYEPVLLNGGFEQPVVQDAALWDIFTSTEVDWSVAWAGSYPGAPTNPYLELHRGVWKPFEGAQYAELDTDWDGPGSLPGEQASVSISQDLQTCDGQIYKVSFAYSPRPDHSDNVLEVYWNGTLLGTYSADGKPHTDTVWTPITLDVEADGPTATLMFVEAGTPDSFGMFLDAVSVTKCDTCS